MQRWRIASEGSLDDPAARRNLEALGAVAAFNVSLHSKTPINLHVKITCHPGRKTFWQQPPGDSAFEHIENRVKDATKTPIWNVSSQGIVAVFPKFRARFF